VGEEEGHYGILLPREVVGSETLKGTHAQDFHSLFLTFFRIIQSLIDTKHSDANIFENLLHSRPDIQNFSSFPAR
jgi:hypothetical protein